jgi:hypothetical protein
MQSLADASTNPHPSSLASARPSYIETSRSVTLSLLFPTSITKASPTGAAADSGELRNEDKDADDFLTH